MGAMRCCTQAGVERATDNASDDAGAFARALLPSGGEGLRPRAHALGHY